MTKRTAALSVQTGSRFWHYKRNETHLVGTPIIATPGNMNELNMLRF